MEDEYKLPFPRYSRILVENFYPLVFGAPIGVKLSDLPNDLWCQKLECCAYQTVKEF